MKKEFLKVQKLILVATVLIFIFSLSTAQLAQAAQDNNIQTLPSFADLADKVKESVVNISTTQVVEGNPMVPFLGPGSPFGDFFGKDFSKRFFGNRPQGKMETHVSDVAKGSPAEKAGLLRGDVILRFNGKETKNAHKLSQLAAATAPGTQVKVNVLRNGIAETVTLTIGTMPSEDQAIVAPKEKTSWGMAVQELTPQLARQLGLEPGTTGVVVSDIKEGSPAAEAGLRPGDIITEVNRKGIKKHNDYQQALKQVKKGGNLLLLIKRGSGALYAVLTPPAKKQ